MTHLSPPPFNIRDCALASIATGIKAQTLTALIDKIASVDHGCIHFHFWEGRLRTAFEHHEYHNDFAHWCHKCLHDDILAERLELLNPTDYDNLEDLRVEVIEIIEERLDEIETLPIAKRDEPFHFIRSKIVVFNTDLMIQQPCDLVKFLPKVSQGSIFYHFIDARRRTEDGKDDFTNWLKGFGKKYQDLIEAIHKIDPYLMGLSELRARLITICEGTS